MKREIKCLFDMAEMDLAPWSPDPESAKKELQQILDSSDATEEDKKLARCMMHRAIDMAAEMRYHVE